MLSTKKRNEKFTNGCLDEEDSCEDGQGSVEPVKVEDHVVVVFEPKLEEIIFQLHFIKQSTSPSAILTTPVMLSKSLGSRVTAKMVQTRPPISPVTR